MSQDYAIDPEAAGAPPAAPRTDQRPEPDRVNLAPPAPPPGFWRRVRLALAWIFWPRGGGPGEADARQALALANARIERQSERLKAERLLLAEEREDRHLVELKRSAEVDAARHELALLASVIERDRLRIESEQAAYAQVIAQAGARKADR